MYKLGDLNVSKIAKMGNFILKYIIGLVYT